MVILTILVVSCSVPFSHRENTIEMYNWGDEDRWTRVRDAWSIALQLEFRAREFLCAYADSLICSAPSMQSQLLTGNYGRELMCTWLKKYLRIGRYLWILSAMSATSKSSQLLLVVRSTSRDRVSCAFREIHWNLKI